jgi:hypothetical protein
VEIELALNGHADGIVGHYRLRLQRFPVAAFVGFVPSRSGFARFVVTRSSRLALRAVLRLDDGLDAPAD